MSKFRKYMHIEKIGNTEVEDLLLGECYVFPKLDGTNASIWLDENENVCAGSRNRKLTAENDNAGFYNWLYSSNANAVNIKVFLKIFPHYHLYGEWLVKHSFKHYRDDVWNRFWLFDIWDAQKECWVNYRDYYKLCETYLMDYIQVQSIINFPTKEQLINQLETNTFLVQDGVGPGEGIVIKRYDFVNKYSRTTWGKLVRNEFKELNQKFFNNGELKTKEGRTFVERVIINNYVTKSFVDKERNKIEQILKNENIDINSREGRSKLIPRLIQTIYYSLIKEHCWDMIKDHKRPTIDFKLLERLCTQAVKNYFKELF